MYLELDEEFREICKKIVTMNKSITEWREIESPDYFQTSSYSGGFDATEDAFCFSYYKDKEEFWFQLTLEEIQQIIEKKFHRLNLRKAELSI